MAWKSRTYTRGGEWITRLTIEQEDQSDSDGPFVFDGTFQEVLEALEKIKEQIPKEYWATAECAFNARGGRYDGDSSFATIEVTYNRPATPDEITAANNARGQSEHAARQREIEQLRALKAKYPDIN